MSKLLLTVASLLIALPTFAVSPDALECEGGIGEPFKLELTADNVWEYRDSQFTMTENRGYSEDLNLLTNEAEISFGKGYNYRAFTFDNQNIDAEGNGTVLLLEVYDNYDYLEYIPVLCKAYTL